MNKQIKLLLFIGFIIGCNTNEKVKTEINSVVTIPNKYAKGFTITKTDEGLIYKVYNPQTNALVDSFFIADIVSFHKTIVFSATYISFLAKINELNTIKGVTYSGGIFNTEIKEKINTREIIDIGSDNEPNKELILDINPDVIFSFPNNNNLDWLKQFDIKNISVTEYLENHPLAQAEWIRFFGYLFHKEQLADSIFNVIESDYNKLVQQQLNTTNKPTVLGGELYDDSWTLPRGKSITSKLIEDAGGN